MSTKYPPVKVVIKLGVEIESLKKNELFPDEVGRPMSHRKFEAPRHGSKGFLPKKRLENLVTLSSLLESLYQLGLHYLCPGPSATVASLSPSPRTIPARRST